MSTVARHRAQPPAVADAFESGYFVPGSTIARRSHRTATALWAIVLVVITAAAALLVLHNIGIGWYIVQSPSMGSVAPVGTLVITEPTDAASLAIGDIITFHPPTAPTETYTHRIVAVNDRGEFSTQGDINSAKDGWTLSENDLLGRVAAIVPGVGWLVRGAPILAVGFGIIWMFSQAVISPTGRSATRLIGASLVFSIAAVVLRPFASVVVLASQSSNSTAQASVVSTGLLPIRVRAEGGTHVDLAAGEVGRVWVTTPSADGHYALTSALNLSPIEWAIALVVCLVPVAWVLIVGLPDSRESQFE